MKARSCTKGLNVLFHSGLLMWIVAASAAAASPETPPASTAGPSREAPKGKTEAGPVTERITRQGVTVEFKAVPAPGRSMTEKEIFAADYVDVSFRLTDATTGRPIRGRFPGAWVDLSKTWEGRNTLETSCKERVGLYLQGSIGIRPAIDLNSYFLLVMNRDPSISIIDPVTGITGMTQLYAQIHLKKPAADWAKMKNQARLFVTMPRANAVAVVDTEAFQVIRTVNAGTEPVRAALQPDEKYLWVGNDAKTAPESGVTAIDADTQVRVKSFATGRGHHEIAFSDDSLRVFVSNRDDGTVSVIDTRRLKKIQDIKTGPLPIALAFSSRRKALYVADGETGEIVVIDGRTLRQAASIAAKPGLGPLGFSQDGAWAIALNSREHVAYAIDPATNRIAHTLAVGNQPYQVAFSRSFAYVRALDTERVSMIDLSELGKAEAPPVVTFAAGQTAPAKAREVSLAEAVVEAPGEAAAMVVSPADATVYYYMEGMNAPSGNFSNYGHMPVAVQVVDRSIKESEPGVYRSTLRIPGSGTYDVAFLLDTPSVLHCFQITARPNPALAPQGPPLEVAFLNEKPRVNVGESLQLRFRLTERKTGKPRSDLKDVYVTYFASPGGRREQVAAQSAGEGIYVAPLPIRAIGTHYVYVACPSEKIQPTDLPFFTVVGISPGESGSGSTGAPGSPVPAHAQ